MNHTIDIERTMNVSKTHFGKTIDKKIAKAVKTEDQFPHVNKTLQKFTLQNQNNSKIWNGNKRRALKLKALRG